MWFALARARPPTHPFLYLVCGLTANNRRTWGKAGSKAKNQPKPKPKAAAKPKPILKEADADDASEEKPHVRFAEDVAGGTAFGGLWCVQEWKVRSVWVFRSQRVRFKMGVSVLPLRWTAHLLTWPSSPCLL